MDMDETTEDTKNEDIPLIDVSSLINLKAELLRKQESLKQAKLNATNETPKFKPFRVKGEVKLQRHKIQIKINEKPSEEDLTLQKSRAALEAKAKLYDKIVSNKVTLNETEDELYLVNFHKKVINNRNSGTFPESSVYSDVASRTSNNPKGLVQTTSGSNIDSSEASTEKGEPVHYQNIQFNEKRDHGVGYFAFSTAEAERQQQMEELTALHDKTKKKRKQHEEVMEKKKVSLESRLAKICRRRNIDTGVISEFTSKLGKDADPPTESPEIVVDLDSIPLPDDVVDKKPVKVRPWDVGKQFIDFQKGEN